MSDQERDAPGAPESPAGGEPEPAAAAAAGEGQPPPADQETASGKEEAAAAAGVPESKEAPAGQPAVPPTQKAVPKAPLSPEEKAALIAKAKAAKEAAAAGKPAEGAAVAAGEKPVAPAKPKHEEDPNKPAWEKDPVAPEWQDAGDDPLASALREELGEAVESARRFAGDLTLEVRRDAVARVAASLKGKHGFMYLVDVCGADYPQREPRFDVVYHLYSAAANRRVRLKVKTDEATPVPSLTAVFRAANWSEREVYDMYGVRFAGHPDMTRILLWEGFNGHPLRKDFPVEGIDTGSAIYPEYYQEGSGPVAGTGTGWKPPERRAAAPAGGKQEAS